MKLYQKSLTTESSSILRVDPRVFAELVSEIPKTKTYIFKITFRLSLKSKKNIYDYDRVVVTVKQKQDAQVSVEETSTFSSAVTSYANRLNNISDSQSYSIAKALKPDNGIPRPKHSRKLSEKLYSGLKILKDLEEVEAYVDRREVNISTYVEEAANSFYDITELVVPTYKPELGKTREVAKYFQFSQVSRDSSAEIPKFIDTSKLDPNNTIERVNRELCDLTEPVHHFLSRHLSSETHLEDAKLKTYLYSNSKGYLFYDLIRYYLDDVPRSPDEPSMTLYEHKKTSKQLTEVEVTTNVFVKADNRHSTLDVRFDLFKKEQNSIDETLAVDLHVPSHLEAYESLKIPPEIKVSPIHTPSGKSDKTSRRSHVSHSLIITDKAGGGKVNSFNVYIKSIHKDGTVSPYSKIANVPNKERNQLLFYAPSDLSILRVVPVDRKNNESNLFTNIAIGPGYESIGALTAIPYHTGGSTVRVDVYNIPSSTVTLTLYKRDCTNDKESNSQTSFTPVSTFRVQNGINTASFTDARNEWGHMYEYYVFGLKLDPINYRELPHVSSFSMIKIPMSNVPEKSISVDISSFTTNKTRAGDVNVSFIITTKASPSENERITKNLKSQLGDLYDQYLNPQNSSSSPLGENNGIPNYADAFFHEVVRTNLSTGERETFDLISDGMFEDNDGTRKTSNVKPVNPLYSYIYQVFTYKKNPVEIFKKFVATGTTVNGRAWFYRPYKWRMPKVKAGKLNADDSHGLPIIDAYEMFTSESYGMTASYLVEGSAKYTSIRSVKTDRIDRNTVKISWEYDGIKKFKNVDLYDSFVVMKTVNGVRYFLGTSSSSFIYHELTSRDVGSVYYTVIPVMSGCTLDSPAHSKQIVISPEGITEKTKTTSLTTATQNNSKKTIGTIRISRDVVKK